MIGRWFPPLFCPAIRKLRITPAWIVLFLGASIARWFPPLYCPATRTIRITPAWAVLILGASIAVESLLPLAAWLSL